MQYHAIPCNTMQYHAISCKTMQYHAIPCNIMQYHAMPCNNMQYHAIPCIINNCWRSVPLPCGQYMAIFLFLPVYAADNCSSAHSLKVLVDYRLETSSYLLVHCHLMNSFLMLLPVYTCTVHCLLIFLSWVKTESIMSFKGERQWYTAKKARTFYVHSHLDKWLTEKCV